MIDLASKLIEIWLSIWFDATLFVDVFAVFKFGNIRNEFTIKCSTTF